MIASIGRIVLYRLNEHDVDAVNRRRQDAQESRVALDKSGYLVHHGNVAHVGDVLPMVIARAWSADTVNGQVFLDGSDTLWVTSRAQGFENGQWSDPRSQPTDTTGAE